MDLLNRLFEKKGIKDVNELSKEERATYDNWKVILAKEELTTNDIKEFCKTQCDIIEGKWKSYDIDQNKKAELIPYHVVYKTLLSAIGSPKNAREALEKQLNEMLK